MNKSWHQRHKMPKNATTDQRLAWHLEHQKQCACRPMPKSLRSLVTRRAVSKKWRRGRH